MKTIYDYKEEEKQNQIIQNPNMLTDEDLLESFVREFHEDGFYSQPRETKLYLKINGEYELIGNAVVANIEESNEKIPVYSFNSSQYAKFLQGKEIITGIIALRKITVANFLSLLPSEPNTEEIKQTLELMKKDAEEIAKIESDEYIDPFLDKLLINIKLYERNRNAMFDEEFCNMNSLIYYMEKLKTQGATAQLKIVYEGKMGESASPSIKIKNVLFTKRQSEINIDRPDIIEVYSFIGNPDY